jgi:transportin-1
LCKSILNNPNGVINYFAFFCDAISQYDNAPTDLESLFQNLISSYKTTLKERWNDYFKLFPEKLKAKMRLRFKVEV